jgi:RloB-like protein
VARQATERIRAESLGRRRGRGLNSFEEGDQVWAVFDRDDHEAFQEAVNRCEQVGVFVGRSNPCFELWLILHQQEYDRPDGRDAVQAHLQRLCPNMTEEDESFPTVPT